MATIHIEWRLMGEEAIRRQTDLAPNGKGNGHAALPNVDHQLPAIPAQLALLDLKHGARPRHRCCSPLCHGPALLTGAVDGNIEGTVVVCCDWSAASKTGCLRPVVVGREDASHEGNQGDAVLTAVAQAVDIPPEITTRWDRLVESRCAIRVAAASRPERAAMGTPAPGWALPPAKKSPGIGVSAEGL